MYKRQIASRRRAGRVGRRRWPRPSRYLEGRALTLQTTASSSLLRERWLPPHAGDGRRCRMALEGAGGVLSRQDAAATPAAPCVRPGYVPRRTHDMLAHFMAVVCKITYGSFIPQSTCGSYRIVSYRIAIFCLISYHIYRFLLWLYRAITTCYNPKQVRVLRKNCVIHTLYVRKYGTAL